MLITEAEKKVLEELRKLDYGRVTVFVQNGKIHRTEVVRSNLIEEEKFFCQVVQYIEISC